eukprot:765827-Hanusia_phi.AAC.1
MISTKETGLLVEEQRVLVLRNNDAELREVGFLDFLGDNIMEILVACLLHCRIRMVQMFLRFVFKLAAKNGSDMIQEVLNVFKKHNVTYNFDMKKKNDYSAVTSLDGTECIKFQEEVIPGIIEVIYARQPEKQAFCKEVFQIWASVDRTLSKKNRADLTAEEIDSLPTRLNSFAIRYSVLTGDKGLFSAVYFHMICQGHVKKLFDLHLNKFGTTLALNSMECVESRHRLVGRVLWKKTIIRDISNSMLAEREKAKVCSSLGIEYQPTQFEFNNEYSKDGSRGELYLVEVYTARYCLESLLDDVEDS